MNKEKNVKIKGSNNTEVHFSFYLVALIDILKQSGELSKIKKLPENDEELKEFIQIAKKSYGTVLGLRESFDSFFNGWNSYKSEEIQELNPEKKSIHQRMLNIEIKKQQFSDTIIFYASLADTPNHFPINNIFVLLLSISVTLICALSTGEVFRGGIDIGIGSNNCFDNEELYGPVLVNAYELESKVAQYPRVVVGRELYNYLEKESRIEINNTESKYRSEMAGKCIKMFCSDIDGLPILDYIGEGIKNQFEKVERDILQNVIKTASAFVEEEYQKYKNKSDAKLALRYFMLRNYFRDRIKKFWSSN